MKSYFFLLMFFIPLGCFAQNQSFDAGLRLGLNTAQVNGDGMGGFNKAGVVGGLFVNYPFNKKWKGQFEMLFAQKGSRRVVSADYVQPGEWNRLASNYIEVPVMAVYNINDKISAQAGLSASYLFSYKFEPLYGAAYQDFLRPFDWSMTGGLSYDITDQFAINARYSQSFISIAKSDVRAANVPFGFGLFNVIAAFSVYYKFMDN